ncbi:alpha/beta fold hydrolase [Roseateles sp. BYS180W]|uniref:Alpha/beta fold hydrolase n=1 Tax=Roseateles rivi TaxID=3299028 RepID=A0ABW7FSF4_9BURK
MSLYTPTRTARSSFVTLRGLRQHLLQWGPPPGPETPLLVLLHGWMDVAASFQFLVDAMAQDRAVVALDWRGFGHSDGTPADGYWFPDYLGDLDALLDLLSPQASVDLLGHSMGGNVVMSYAGVRPRRVRRLINLEGFGLPDTQPEQAPGRLAMWLDELRQRPELRHYPSADAVALRLRKNNPRLSPDKAQWLARQWARELPDGQWQLLADPLHKRSHPMLYRSAEILAGWRLIQAPTLWVQGEHSSPTQIFGDRYGDAELQQRLACVPQLQRQRLAQAGHMLHHDQPQALAQLLERFLA